VGLKWGNWNDLAL